MVRCLVIEKRNDDVEDVLAGLARVTLNSEQTQEAIGTLHRLRCASVDRRVAQEALAALDSLAADSALRCQVIQRAVIDLTGYPYGRHGRDPVAEEVTA